MPDHNQLAEYASALEEALAAARKLMRYLTPYCSCGGCGHCSGEDDARAEYHCALHKLAEVRQRLQEKPSADSRPFPQQETTFVSSSGLCASTCPRWSLKPGLEPEPWQHDVKRTCGTCANYDYQQMLCQLGGDWNASHTVS